MVHSTKSKCKLVTSPSVIVKSETKELRRNLGLYLWKQFAKGKRKHALLTGKFKLFTNPRYLLGTAPLNVLEEDLVHYNRHLYNLCMSKNLVDNSPPKLSTENFLHVTTRTHDLKRIREIYADNANLLKKLHKIRMEKKGRVDHYFDSGILQQKNMTWSSNHASKMNYIKIENKKIHRTLKEIRSAYCKNDQIKSYQALKHTFIHTSKMSRYVIHENMDHKLKKMESITGILLPKCKSLPKCFLDFKVVDGEYLGYVIVELYHDYVPVTVQNFLEICKGTDGNGLTYKGCPIHRIVPEKFFETGDITKGTGKGGYSIYGENFAEEKHILSHSKAGVLSMKRIGSNQINNSQFCVSFAKIAQFDKKNVVFGKIVKGADTIFKIQTYGRRIGKPLAQIIISNCGECTE